MRGETRYNAGCNNHGPSARPQMRVSVQPMFARLRDLGYQQQWKRRVSKSRGDHRQNPIARRSAARHESIFKATQRMSP
jgi:hypothetical protein